MQPILSISKLTKSYASGFQALKGVDLDVREGEILALLGPNGAGKTTLISIACGLVRATSGRITIGGHDIADHYRAARGMVGLVPQELTTDAFETVWDTVTFSRGLFGKSRSPRHIEKVLRDLSLWDKKDSQLRQLSGGMKRRVLIAKALSHEPRLLFLDEPTAGVDVELRRDMWRLVDGLRRDGVTILLTTHYIEEAEEMADRIGVIRGGELILVEEKAALMRKLGRKRLVLDLAAPLAEVPGRLAAHRLERSANGSRLTYTYEPGGGPADIRRLLDDLAIAGVAVRDVTTSQNTLEDIFVNLVRVPGHAAASETGPAAEAGGQMLEATLSEEGARP